MHPLYFVSSAKKYAGNALDMPLIPIGTLGISSMKQDLAYGFVPSLANLPGWANRTLVGC
jgi:hypothetical protein